MTYKISYDTSKGERVCQTTLIFYKNTRLIFAQNLKTIPASAKEQSLKF